MPRLDEKNIVFFDEQCRLCRGAVRFIAQRDRHSSILFSPLQSKLGQRIAQTAGIDTERPGSLVFQETSQIYTRSAAALRIARHLKDPWPLVRVFWIVPRPLRDFLYNWIARNRYKWFGQVDETVSASDQAWRERLITDEAAAAPDIAKPSRQ